MKYNCIDFFCGCGGLSLGFKQAGFNIIMGIDSDENAIKTYNKNFNNVGYRLDVLDVNGKEILKKLPKDTKVDVLIGGPPCQGFSAANQWTKDNDDDRNKLVLYYAKHIEYLEPKMFLVENVKGMLAPSKVHIKDQILKIFDKIGYTIHGPEILNAADYLVPQKRERVFFIGTKKGYNFKFPEKKDIKYTVKDAISDLYIFEDKQDDEPIKHKLKTESVYQKLIRENSEIVYNHHPKLPAEITQLKISHVPQGGNWKDIPLDVIGNNRSNRHSSAYKRLSEKEPSITIDTGNAHSNYFHPLFNRIPSVREAARLQSFPDTFIFEGPRGSQYRQVGNAVPPLLSKAIAEEFMKSLGNYNE
ncbi:DNA (cytosine-5-)-methyltransferase [Arcobacter sp. CECT 8983]|uniref:DNA cytosine methyltransferase n=1 Tax=Arcobacter sp. CECT 8983 TaxID=2044508 RepID=UPI00100B4AAA|nr:DNA cytosine methyltransferase [Arcobacter sp. CECT 8983]RXJ91681.1 DNA (cytosine-5-)-methyltransferase [Arcobacter sp. CECT 8983]